MAAAPSRGPAARRPRRPGVGRRPSARWCAASRTRARRSSSPSTSRGRCARPTSSPTGWPPRRTPPATFVENQPKGVRMGLVVFSGFAELAVPPTTDRKALLAAIDGLTTGRGTAIGSAMLKGLDAIAEVNPAVSPVGDAPEPVTAPLGSERRAPRGSSRHRRAPHRRREQPRDRAARRRAVRGRAAGSRLHDRFRDDEPPAALVHARTARRQTSSIPAGSAAAEAEAGSAVAGRRWIRAVPDRRHADLDGGRHEDRRDVPRCPGRRRAAQGVRGSAERGRKAEAADRDQLDAGGARRAARLSVRSRASMRWSPYP